MNEKFELRAERNYLAINQIMLLTSGSVNVYPVKITFSADWNGLDRRVVFRAGGGDVFAVELDEAGTCNIPWEALTEPNKPLSVGVYGTKGGDTVLPTIWADLGFIYPGAEPGEGSGPPTPDAWQQLKDDLKQASEELADIKKYSDAAGESAKQASGAVETVGRLVQGASGAAAEASRQATAADTSAGAAEQSRKDADAARAAAETARAEAKEHMDAAKRSEDEALKSANTAKQYSGKPAIPQNGTWWLWNADKQAYVDTGEPANLNPRGEYDPEAVYKRWDLVQRAGSSYLALRSDLQGVLPIGGEDWMCVLERCGKSAYEQALDGGLTATEAEFKSALAKVVDAWGNWHYDLTDEEMSDPDIVYAKSRPSDWMKMPAMEDVQDGEIWLLFQWLPGDTVNDNVEVRSDTEFKIHAGRYEDGVFTPQEKYTKDYPPSDPRWSTAVTISLDSADFGDLTSTGRVQAMVRISGELTEFNCGTLNDTNRHYVDAVLRGTSLKNLYLQAQSVRYVAIADISENVVNVRCANSPNLLAVRGSAKWLNVLSDLGGIYLAPFNECWNLLAIPVDAKFDQSANVQLAINNCYSLRYLPPSVTFAGVVNGIDALHGCHSLRYLPPGATFASLKNGQSMLQNCCALRELPAGVTFASLENGQDMLRDCHSLRYLPPGATFASLKNGQSMLQNCYALLELADASFPEATTMANLAYACSSLQRITNLYIPKCSNITNAFFGCSSLEELTFGPRMTTWETPQDIGLANTRLSHAAIVALFESLPTIQTAKTITLTNAPGASQVTADDVAIATDKGWLVAGVPAGIATGSPGSVEGPEIFASKQDVQAVWDQMAAAYAEGVNEA